LEKQRKSIDLPWPAIMAALAAVGGVFLYLNPLETSRPAERTGFQLNLDRSQDVDARLWQDPLRTATEHEAQVFSRRKDAPEQSEQENQRHSVGHFWLGHKPDECWVLAVMIPGGSYSEYSEPRLRMRQAVLEALGAEHYVPADGEHIGYVKIDNPSWNWGSMIVPFEWCDREVHEGSNEPSTLRLPDHVCVLWLRDEEFQTNPALRLNWLLRDPDGCFRVDMSQIKIRIVGPRTSTTLRAMVEEVAKTTERLPLLQDVEIWSPTATASDALLLNGLDGVKGYSSVQDLLEARLGAEGHPLLFRRATVTDKDVIQALLKELRENRGLKLGYDYGNNGKLDRIALISEWDTFYGRALPITLEREVCHTNIETLLAGIHAKNFLVFHYLRGIDGMLPGTLAGNEDKSKESAKQSSVAREMTEGLNQSDYLRRLSRELADRNAALVKNGEPGIRAVGVLGSDVYDKLLVLEALRRTLPDAIFFTNSLDARFAHPDEWRWTRNLLVASPFGPSVDDGHNERILPFRDSDQTACYTATLFAAGSKVRDRFINDTPILTPVRLYEIGRNGAFDLTVIPPADREGHRATIQPASPDIQQWRNRSRLFRAGGIVFFVLCGLAWVLSIIVGRRHLGPQEIGDRSGNSSADDAERGLAARRKDTERGRQRVRRARVWLHWQLFRHNRSVNRVLFSSWSMFVILTLFSIFWVWVIACLGGPDGEPYSWNDGISIWPTETLRLLAFLLSIFYILKIWRALHRNEQQLQLHFFPRLEHREPEQKHALFSKPWWRGLAKEVTVRHWKCEEGHRVIATKLWTRYRRSGEQRARFWRITPLILCYVGAGVLLMMLLGWPSVPARGAWARYWDIFFVVCSIAGSLFLTFYVADVTLLNRRLIHYLTKGVTLWPEEAFANLRGRWRLREQVVAELGPQDAFDNLRRDLRAIAAAVAAKFKLRSITAESTEEIPPTELLVDYLDIDLIARRTKIVGGFIYYPLIVISLLIISRSGIFDHWTWPLPLLILLGFNAGYAVFSAVYLRRTAERARQSALQRLNDRLMAYTAAGHGDEKEAKTIRETANLIRAEDRGAFAAISQHPLAGALLLPSGSAGIWILLQYFPRLFS
jgi:hypothetical protein